MLAVYTLVVIILSVAFFGLAQLVWQKSQSPSHTISNDIVIDRVEEQAFIVTRTVYSDQEVQIKIDRGSDWNEFLWGKTITATARVRTDVGIDFEGISKDNIEIDASANTVSIKGLQTRILDSSIYSKLEVTTSGTILAKLFDNDSNADYQLASAELTKSAKAAIESDAELLNEAKDAAAQYLSYLFSDLDYAVRLE